MKKYLSYIYVILSAVCWGFIGFSNRMLTEVGVSLGNRVFIRNFGTLVILTIVFALFHRQVFRIKLKHLPIFLCSGLLSILTLSLVYFQCQTMCSLSVAAVLLYLAPSFVVIFSAVLWKTPLTKRKLIALVVSLLGCVMVSGIIGGDMTASWAGIGLGVLSGLCYASYTVFAHYGLAHYGSYTMIYWTFLVAGLGSVFSRTSRRCRWPFPAHRASWACAVWSLWPRCCPTSSIRRGLRAWKAAAPPSLPTSSRWWRPS